MGVAIGGAAAGDVIALCGLCGLCCGLHLAYLLVLGAAAARRCGAKRNLRVAAR